MATAQQEPLVKGDKKDAPPEQRDFSVVDTQANAASNFSGNAIATAKYSFIPLSPHFIVWKNLFEQFHKAANVYFLIISALQLIPGISPTGRFTTLIPLTIVLAVTMAKDFYEDVKRHQSDGEVNNRKTYVYRDGAWTPVPWKDLKVGEVCKVLKHEPFAADLILVWSPLPEGMCYIETASLDGETNLKIRKAVQGIYKIFDPRKPDEACAGKITCELPNNRLYNFDGFFEKPGKTKLSLTADNILLRGANLRNTEEAIGITVFTGPDTKLMRNSSAKSSKMSHVDHVTNRQIIYVFIFLVILCIGSTLGSTIVKTTQTDIWYLPSAGEDPLVVTIFGGFATFLILFNNLIPISLYVTMETVKLFQAGLINSDITMYHEETDTPAQARTSSLCEELGQVEYIFSDKTGTLTCNMMDFLKFTCAQYHPFQQKEVVVSYGTGTTEIGRAAAKREGRELKDDRPPGWSPKGGLYFYDQRINDLEWSRQPNAEQLEFFFVFLAVCHSVIPERGDKGELVYQAASPDEGCLVKAAQDMGCEFLERTEGSITIVVRGQRQVWEILDVIEFNSTRKRMSVICQDPKGRLMLLCKGADSVMYERLRKTAKNQELHDETLEILTQFAAEGLRTLVLGKIDLDEPTYNRWHKKYHDASMAIKDRGDKMAAVAEEIEVNLELVGTTAIEDKLQGEVPQTIELLMTAGIKVWVLTGDKQETAINIGFACALLHNDMGLFMFDDCEKGSIKQVLQCYVSDAKSVTQQDLGLVIQGDMLEHILPTEEEKTMQKAQGLKPEASLFLQLGTRCRAVVCCRVSPLQKAQVVMLVRDNQEAVTLAIGDGANDVSMIQAAHVGIGISGLEGLQAARASDYSIAQFRFLQQLLLIHGRYSYRRTSKLILYCFYKNVTLFLTQFWFASMNMFTGQTLYDRWALSGYNMAFTATPIIALAVLDKDVEPHFLLSKDLFPELYNDGRKDLIFNTVSFWMYTGNAIFHSLVAFLIPVYITELLVNVDGQAMGLVGTGVTCYTVTLFIVTAKNAFEIQSWTIPNVVTLVFSIASWYAFLGIYGTLFSWGASFISSSAWWYGMPGQMLAHPVYWFTLLVACTIALFREVAWKCWKHNFSQKLMHIVQEFRAQGKSFHRRDVLRCAPHLLPKFDSLRPFDPNAKGGREAVNNENEVSLSTLASITKGLSQKVYVSDAKSDKKTTANVSRAPVTGAYIAQPGKVKIKDIVLDDYDDL